MLFKNAELLENGAMSALNHLGFGVFETFAIKKVGTEAVILALGLHMKRLSEGCSKLKIQGPKEQDIIDLLIRAVKQLDWAESTQYRGRIVVLEDDWYFQTSALTMPAPSLRLKTVAMQRPLPEIKSCSAIVSVLSDKIAKAAGFDEALLIDDQHRMLETSWGNIFFVDQSGSIHTADADILHGVTREIVIDLAGGSVKYIPEKTGLHRLAEMQEVFVTRSTTGLVPVTRIDDIEFPKTELSAQLQRKYLQLYSVEPANSLRTGFSI